MKKKLILIVFLTLIFFIVFLSILHIYFFPKLYIASKYNVSLSNIEIEEYYPSTLKYEKHLFDFDAPPSYMFLSSEKWKCTMNNRSFNIEFFRLHYVDDYQLEDILEWCTNYLKNTDKNIKGIDIGTDIIYRSPDKYRGKIKNLYKLPYSDNKLWNENDVLDILEFLVKRNGHITVFYKVENIEKYGEYDQDYNYYIGNEKYYKLSSNVNNNKQRLHCFIVLFDEDLEPYRSSQNNAMGEPYCVSMYYGFKRFVWR